MVITPIFYKQKDSLNSICCGRGHWKKSAEVYTWTAGTAFLRLGLSGVRYAFYLLKGVRHELCAQPMSLYHMHIMLCVNRSWIGVVTWCLRVIKCREPGRPFRTLLFSEVLEAIQLLKRAKCFSTIRLSDLFLVTFSYVSSDSHNLLADRIIFFVIVARYCIGHIFLSNPKFQHVWSIMFQCLALFFSLHFL